MSSSHSTLSSEHSDRDSWSAATSLPEDLPPPSFYELELLPYYDNESEFEYQHYDMWVALLDTVDELRSDVLADVALGVEHTLKLLKHMEQLDPSMIPEVLRRVILELHRADSIFPPLQEPLGDVQGEIDRLSQQYSIDLTVLERQEVTRLENIAMGDWDGKVNFERHMEIREEAYRISERHRRIRWWTRFSMIGLVALPMLFGVCIVVMGLLFWGQAIALSPEQLNVFTLFVAVVSLLCALSALLVSLILFNMSCSEGDNRPILAYLNIRVVIIIFGSLFVAGMGFNLLCFSCNEDALNFDDDRLQFVRASTVVHFVLFVLACSLIASWTHQLRPRTQATCPAQCWLPKPSVIYVCSFSHWIRNGICSCKCWKPLFRDRDAILTHLEPTMDTLKRHRQVRKRASKAKRPGNILSTTRAPSRHQTKEAVRRMDLMKAALGGGSQANQKASIDLV